MLFFVPWLNRKSSLHSLGEAEVTLLLIGVFAYSMTSLVAGAVAALYALNMSLFIYRNTLLKV
jgi:sorbitol-specific phosphotransferase system component IIBC